MPRKAATWRCCSGRARTAARGTRGLARCREGGHLEVLQWARANGAPWDEMTCRDSRERRPPGGAAVGARERRSVGRVDLRTCRGRRPPGGAAVGARERRSVGREDLPRCRGGGHLEVLQWARANGCPWNEWTCAMPRKAATWRCCSGRERTALRGTSGLAPMPRKAATWRCCSGRARTALRGTRGLARDAAEGGHLEVLQWARANGAPWDEWTCAGAAEGGHLEVLQWARANGAPWDERTCRRCRGRRPPGGATVGARERRSGIRR